MVDGAELLSVEGCVSNVRWCAVVYGAALLFEDGGVSSVRWCALACVGVRWCMVVYLFLIHISEPTRLY